MIQFEEHIFSFMGGKKPPTRKCQGTERTSPKLMAYGKRWVRIGSDRIDPLARCGWIGRCEHLHWNTVEHVGRRRLTILKREKDQHFSPR